MRRTDLITQSNVEIIGRILFFVVKSRAGGGVG